MIQERRIEFALPDIRAVFPDYRAIITVEDNTGGYEAWAHVPVAITVTTEDDEFYFSATRAELEQFIDILVATLGDLEA